MQRPIEEEFIPEQVPYVEPVWRFLAENGKQGAWLLSVDLMDLVFDLVRKNAENIAKYEQVTDEDTLVLRYIKIILPLLQQLNAEERASFAQGFLEHVVEWQLEE